MLSALLALTGCSGSIGEPGKIWGLNDAGTVVAMDGGVDPTLPDIPGSACHVPPCEPPPGALGPQEPSPQTRFPRLTHLQWENTVRDLLHLNAPTGLVETLIPDVSTSGYSTNATALKVTADLWADYERVSRELAAVVRADPQLVAGISPDPMPSTLAEQRDAFIAEFGRRAFRRPLTTDEATRYAQLFDDAPAILFANDAYEAGVELTLRAMLQSPFFLYRMELGTTEVDGAIPLSGYEIAARLSYSLWNTMPSDAMLDAAEAGQFDTPEAIRDQVALMLEDMRAQNMVASFHHEYLHTSTFFDIKKQEGLFPEWLPTTGADLRHELELFVLDLVFQSDGGFSELLTSPFTYVNENLAAIYGVEGVSGEAFQRVELDPTQRAGVLTRLGPLAYNSTLAQPDPIHRGVFVAKDIICADLPPPPMNVPSVPSDSAPTNRERVDLHTGKGTCGEGCHSSIINPAGFPFEYYDSIGAFRTEDNGYPVNGADTYILDGHPASYDNAVEFSAVLAASLQVNRCYAQQWLDYLYGRDHTNADEPLLYDIAARSRDGVLTIKELIAELLTSPAYLTRSTQPFELATDQTNGGDP